MRVFVIALVSLSPFLCRAGDRFAVLPTEDMGGAPAQAALTTHAMFGTLGSGSLDVAASADVERAIQEAGAVACDSLEACARAVGPTVGATKVVISEVWPQLGGYELRVAAVDLRAGVTLKADDWLSFVAKDQAMLTSQAEQAVLTVLKLELFGRVSMAMSEVGAEVLIDGVAKGTTPILTPFTVGVGRHDLEVRYGNRAPWRGFVEVQRDQTSTLTLCANATAVEECADPRPGDDTTMKPLFVGGLVGAGLGAVGLVAGTLGLLGTNAAFEDYRNRGQSDAIDSIGMFRVVTVAGLGLGSVLLVGGGAATAASMVIE